MKKFSILIPTKNGIKYLKYAIESIINQDYYDYELIISDNHSTDGTKIYLDGLRHDAVRLIKPSVPLSISEHYEFILSHAAGEWVILIGDDDALSPDFFKNVDAYIKNYPKIRIIKGKRCYYFWDGCQDKYGDIVFNYKSTDKISKKNGLLQLLLCLSGYGSAFDLPQIYTNTIVSNNLIAEIRVKQGGKFYHSIIPDIYSSIALVNHSEVYLEVDHPLSVVGSSSKSMGFEDRVYKEGSKKVSTLHKEMPKVLHSLGFGPIYLYEGILQAPYKHKILITVLIKYLYFSSVFIFIINGKYNVKVSRKKAYLAYKNYLKENNIKMLKILIISFIPLILNFINILLKIFYLIKINIYKYLKIRNAFFIYSKNRSKFSNINIASNFACTKTKK